MAASIRMSCDEEPSYRRHLLDWPLFMMDGTTYAWLLLVLASTLLEINHHSCVLVKNVDVELVSVVRTFIAEAGLNVTRDLRPKASNHLERANSFGSIRSSHSRYETLA
ncbi:hypothetical protein LZ32DRAFT_602526 [Colletotrichum eremochloae]|nr:hypothetical protein LZ32DRAFT_602526 [Colletotrichum eremochloae]